MNATQRSLTRPQRPLTLPRPYRTSPNRLSTATSTDKKPARYDLTSIRRSRDQDIRNYLSAITAAVTTTHVMQAATEEPTTPTDNIISRFRALRNRLQPPRTHVPQATTEEPTTSTVNTLSHLRALRNRYQHPRSQETQATTEEPTTSTVSTFTRLRALRNRVLQARTQPYTILTDTWRFFPGRNSPS
jgi:hypothetical protein